MVNAVYYNGRCIGYKCFVCDEVKQSMWGTKCNLCRSKITKLTELKKLTEMLKNLPDFLKPNDK